MRFKCLRKFRFIPMIAAVGIVANFLAPARVLGGSLPPNTWATGTPMPTSRETPFIGVIGGKIYVVGGGTNTSVLNVNEIYNTATNTWSTGAPMPTARQTGASAVVDGILYAIGGANANGSQAFNVVEAYNASTNSWSTKAPMPIAEDSMYAVAVSNIIYVVGGYAPGSGRLATVFAYNPSSDNWTTVAPLLLAKSQAALGGFGLNIIAIGGLTNPTDQDVTPDNELYHVATNSWTTRTPMPTARNGACYENVGNLVYVAGGNPIGNTQSPQLNTMDAYNVATNSWITGLPTMPYAIVNAGSASVDGIFYCIGGTNDGNPEQGTIFNYVQIYRPSQK